LSDRNDSRKVVMSLRQIIRLLPSTRQNGRQIIQIKCEIHVSSIYFNDKLGPARSRRNGFYEVLGVPQSSRLVDIKAAYLRIAKKHHPDRAGSDNQESREIFDEASEAYQCLMDPTQRHFYDSHGYPSDELRKKGMPSIFDYKPRFGIYESEIRADNESSAVEDWFKAQGHSVNEPNIGIRQRLKNMYVELRYGLNYYNFPWRIRAFFSAILIWIGVCGSLALILGWYLKYRNGLLDPQDPTLPTRNNDAWNSADRDNDVQGLFGHRPKILKNLRPDDGSRTYNSTNYVKPQPQPTKPIKVRRREQRIAVLRDRLSQLENESLRIQKTLKELQSPPK